MQKYEAQLRGLIKSNTSDHLISVKEYFLTEGEKKATKGLIEIGINGALKELWPNVSKLLLTWKHNETVIDYFLDSLADKNWPGYSTNYQTLLSIGKTIIPTVEIHIKKAMDQNDELWEENLQELKSEMLVN